MKRSALFAALLLAGSLARGADAPPPKSGETPAPKHKLGGSFKGHPIAPSPATGEAPKAAARPASPPARNGPRIVIDNAMVKGSASEGEKGASPNAPSSKTAPAPPPPVTMPKIVDLQGHDEAYWKAKAAATRDAVQKAQDALAAAEAEEKRQENDFYAWDDGQYRDNVIKPAWDRAKEETIKAHSALEAAQKQLDDLEDEARRAGAYPGWIR